MLQLVRGLQDMTIQERVLQEAASVESGELSLAKVIKLVEAAEMGKSSQASISKAGAVVGRLLEHKRGKEEGKQKQRSNRTPGKVDKSCGSCGRSDHGSGLQERCDAPCPAFSIKCRGCSVLGNFKKYCPKGCSRSK